MGCHVATGARMKKYYHIGKTTGIWGLIIEKNNLVR